MKVVHIVEALAGGITTYFKDLSDYFGGDSVEVETIETIVLYSNNRKEVDSKKIEKEFSKGITLIELDMIREFSIVKDLSSLINLYKTLKKINPDVVHLHSSKAGALGRLACFMLFNKKIKVFYTPHGYSFIREDISSFSKKTYWYIEKLIQKLFGGTIIACGDTEYVLSKKIGKSILNRNGISVSEIQKHVSEYKNQKLTIGIVARITFARNPTLFNDIALLFPEYDFVWIGDGELIGKITASNIRITGWFMDSEKVFFELNKIDVYLQTSLWEGLPIAVLEAMAMSKPVIATDIIGNKDLVITNKTGFLFNNINELKNYFKILENPETRKIFGNNAVERCNLFFNKTTNFKNLLTIYQS